MPPPKNTGPMFGIAPATYAIAPEWRQEPLTLARIYAATRTAQARIVVTPEESRRSPPPMPVIQLEDID